MPEGILNQINWVDILVLIILIRTVYVAHKRGLTVEFFKLLGTLTSLYLALNYYCLLSFIAQKRLCLGEISPKIICVFSLFILWVLGYLAFSILQKIFSRFIKMEATPDLNKWGGFVFGIGRAFLVTSLIIFILTASGFVYFKKSIKNSYSGSFIFEFAPEVYSGIFNGIIVKFTPSGKINQVVFDLKKEVTR